MLLFPIFNVPFDVHTDASDFLIGVLSFKYQKTAALFSTKLKYIKKRCTTKKKEPILLWILLSSIVQHYWVT